MSFSIDTRDIHRLETKLRLLNKRGLPYAEVNALNDAAFQCQRDYRGQIRSDFTNRNKWTERGVQLDRASRSRSQAEVGSVNGYMADQEFGGQKAVQGASVAIATTYAAKGRRGGKRDKAVMRRNYLSRIKLRGGHGTVQDKVRRSLQDGSRVFYHRFNNRVEGIFRVKGGTKRRPQRARIHMLYDLSRDTIRIERRPMLEPAAERAAARLPRLYQRRLMQQLKRL